MAAAAAAMEGVPLEVPIWLRSRAEKPKGRYLYDVRLVFRIKPLSPSSLSHITIVCF